MRAEILTGRKLKFALDRDKLTPAIAHEISNAVLSGLSISTAAKLNGISPGALSRWLRAVSCGGTDPSSGYTATQLDYVLYRSLAQAEAQNEQITIQAMQALGHGRLGYKTKIITKEVVIQQVVDGAIKNVPITETITEETYAPPNFFALSWFAERRHRQWSTPGKSGRLSNMGLESIDKELEVPYDRVDLPENANGITAPTPMIIQVNQLNSSASASESEARRLGVDPKLVAGSGRLSKVDSIPHDPGKRLLPGGGQVNSGDLVSSIEFEDAQIIEQSTKPKVAPVTAEPPHPLHPLHPPHTVMPDEDSMSTADALAKLIQERSARLNSHRDGYAAKPANPADPKNPAIPNKPDGPDNQN
jgi:transposase-like protein